MSNYQGSIIVKLADQVIDDDFITHILKALPTVSGFAVAVENGEIGMLVIDGASDGTTTLEQVNGVQEDYMDSTCVFYFAKFPEKFSEESCQPFTVIDDELCCFMDGNFDEKATPDSKYSPEYDVFNKFIKPTLIRIYKGADKDIHATMDEIAKDPGLAEQLQMYYKGRGTILLLASNGEQITFGENALMAEDDKWGWTSNPMDYGKETVVEKVVATVKRGFGGARNLKGAAVTASTVKSAIPRNVAASDGDEAHKYHAPPLNATKAEKGEWYLTNNEGIIPPGYKQCPKVLKMEFRPIKTLKDDRLKKAADAAVKRPIADVIPVRQRNGKGKPDTPAVTAEVLPVLAPNTLKELAKFMKVDLVAKNVNEGRNILDPERLADLEKEHPTFIEYAGLKGLEETFRWKYEAGVELGKQVGIEALAVLWFNTRNAYMRYLAADDEEAGGEIDTEIVNEPEVIPEKKSGFGGARKLR